MSKIISNEAIKRRNFWVEEIRKLSGNFSNDSEKLEKELEAEIKQNGISSLTTCDFAEIFPKVMDMTQAKKNSTQNIRTVYFLWHTRHWD